MEIYFDNAATTRTDIRVIEFMRQYFEDLYGNPSSLHRTGQKASEDVENARQTLGKQINASQNEIVFTSGGTESNNLAIMGVVKNLKHKGKHIITSQIEHPSVLKTFKQMQKEGYEVTFLPVSRQGIVELERLNESIRRDTVLVSIMHVNNETGAIQPITEIGKLCRDNNVFFHTDAVQSFGKLPINVKRMNIDLLSVSAHKFHGPKGVGMLYAKEGIVLKPIMFGGHQERGVRPGTLNVPGIMGMMKAAEIAHNNMDRTHERLKKLSTKIIKGVLNNIKKTFLNGPGPDQNNGKFRYPGIVNLGFSFIEGESLLLLLDKEGISCSTGSACASGSLEPSHVLLAMGLRPEQAHGSIRFSLSRYNTEEEVNYLLEKLPEMVTRLRKISPFKDEESLREFAKRTHSTHREA